MIEPLAKGRVSLEQQAQTLGVDLPVGMTVAQIKEIGFNTDPLWSDNAIVDRDKSSPTGVVVRWPFASEVMVWALAT